MRQLLLLVLVYGCTITKAVAQPDSSSQRPGIYFPQAPLAHQWRRSVGILLTTTPAELTEELRISVPAIDYNFQRGLSRHFYLTGRLQSQFLQNNLTLGIRFATPLSPKLFLSAGYDVSGWFGFLKVKNLFNSQALGVQNFPNLSLGYRLNPDVQLTLKTEGIRNAYYQSTVGGLTVRRFYWPQNGYAFTIILEQPYFHKRHVSVGIRAAYSRFDWQFWALYSTFDKPLFFPQAIFNFIL